MTKQRATPGRDRVHELLLDGVRPRDIETTLSLSTTAFAKHVAGLRSMGLLVPPTSDFFERTIPEGAGLRVVFDQYGLARSLCGWAMGVPIPKRIEPNERGVQGHHDWQLMIVGPKVSDVWCWVHMRGQRISERDVATRLAYAALAPAIRLATLALGCSTGLEVVLEKPIGGDDAGE